MPPEQISPSVMSPSNKDPRLYLAAERTFLAWIRTGLALMGLGFVVARFGLFLREIGAVTAREPVQTSGFSVWAGTALVVTGVVVNIVSAVQHTRIIRGFDEGRGWSSGPSRTGLILAGLLAVAGLSMAVYLTVVR